MSTAPHSRDSRLQTALCFVLPLGLYLLTAARSVQGGDTGEFALIGMVGGVAHPPGYPLYTLLLRAISLLPIEPPFFRMALASALCAAATVAVLQRVLWRLTQQSWVSTIGALSFGVSALHWRLAGVPEVFALHALSVAATMLCVLRLLQSPDEKIRQELVLFGLVLGLGMSNHLTLVLCGPLVLMAAYVAVQRFGRQSGTLALLPMVATGLLGMTPYFLLLRWGRRDPTKAWAWGKVDSLSRLAAHFLRKEYGTFQLHPGNHTATEGGHYIVAFLADLPKQYAYLFFALGLLGVFFLFQRHRVFAIALTGSFLLAGIVFPGAMNLQRSALNAIIAERFFLMPTVLFAPFVGMGLAVLWERLSPRLLAPLLVIALVASAAVTYPLVNWRRDTLIERYLVATVRDLPPNSILIGHSDTLGPGLGWVSRVLKVRPDVHYIDTNLVAAPWYYDRIKQEIPNYSLPNIAPGADLPGYAASLAKIAPTYVFPWIIPDVRQRTPLEPAGLVYRVVPPGTPPLTTEALASRLDQAMQRLGDAEAEPLDAWSAKVQQAILFPWVELMESYRRAGMTAQYEATLQRASRIQPPENPEDVDPADGDPAAVLGLSQP